MLIKLIIFLTICLIQINAYNRSFVVDYENDTFMKDGRPFRYISGSLHYFRVPHQYWEDRLKKYKKAGLNTVQTYIEWSLHEPFKGQYDFRGDNDVFRFIELAQEQHLLVILRVGPYICAERDNGGLPFWLKQLDPDVKIRRNDPKFMKHVEDWFDILLPKLRKYLYKNGGPVILVQIENEYGSYFACDFDYTDALKKITQKHLKNDVVLFTTDGPDHNYLKCGKIAGVLPAIDFGTKMDPQGAFENLRVHLPKGPLINNEFYPGWLDHWAEKHNKVDSKEICDVLDQMLKMKASVNFYMLHGGTSFGFWSGANSFEGKTYQSDLTSYDYDAPINEYGNLTQKYFDIQKVISNYAPVQTITPNDFVQLMVPPRVELKLLEKNLLDLLLENQPKKSNKTELFESLGVQFGFVLYRTTIDFKPTVPAKLTVKGLRDRAYVYVDRIFQGILSRSELIDSTTIIANKGSDLMILVESQGRVNFGDDTGETKGIGSYVSIGSRKLNTNLWSHYGTADWGHIVDEAMNLSFAKEHRSDLQYKSRFFRGDFELNETPKDTLIDTTNWTKGVLWINGHNLGKYWPSVGPQLTLYCPGVWLNKGKNTIILMEQEADHCVNGVCSISFTNIHEIDSEVPEPMEYNISNKTTVNQ